MNRNNPYFKNLYLLVLLLTLGFLNIFSSLSSRHSGSIIYSLLMIMAILVSVTVLVYQNKIYSGRGISQNRRLKAALKAGNLTLLTLYFDDMTIEQETPFTYDGEEPESFGGPHELAIIMDQIIHPQDHHIVKDIIHEFQHEGIEEAHIDIRIIHFGEWLWFRFYISLDTPERIVLLGQMIHKEKKVNEELYHKANFDGLTNLVNRHYCHSYLERALEQNRKRDFPMTIAYVDADSLKEVNDRLGHNYGDRYLKDISRILAMGIREDDVLGRIGGDEFLLICPRTTAKDFLSIEARIEGERTLLNRNPESVYEISFSLGFVEVDHSDNYTVDQLFEEADNRMYKVKKKKKALGQGILVVK